MQYSIRGGNPFLAHFLHPSGSLLIPFVLFAQLCDMVADTTQLKPQVLQSVWRFSRYFPHIGLPGLDFNLKMQLYKMASWSCALSLYILPERLEERRFFVKNNSMHQFNSHVFNCANHSLILRPSQVSDNSPIVYLFRGIVIASL